METGKNARTTAFVAAVAALVALLVALPGAARADGSSFAAANAAAGSSSLPAGTPDSTCGVTCEGGSDPEWYPNFGTTDSVSDIGLDSTRTKHCFSTANSGDGWTRGGWIYKRDLWVKASWCANAGQSQLVSFGIAPSWPAGAGCNGSNFRHDTWSGGIGYSWISVRYQIDWVCYPPWGIPFHDQTWFIVRYGTYGAHYMTAWN